MRSWLEPTLEQHAAVPSKNYFVQQAASLLRLAKETRDPELAATLLAKAADLNEK
jgi:hypothetical protein